MKALCIMAKHYLLTVEFKHIKKAMNLLKQSLEKMENG
ncbi:hypothetical protein CHCC20442_1423 [Bacillus licheniformis]|nr:hypothetical protein CHCC20442_1423 [Bacillus licheniformis]